MRVDHDRADREHAVLEGLGQVVDGLAVFAGLDGVGVGVTGLPRAGPSTSSAGSASVIAAERTRCCLVRGRGRAELPGADHFVKGVAERVAGVLQGAPSGIQGVR